MSGLRVSCEWFACDLRVVCEWLGRRPHGPIHMVADPFRLVGRGPDGTGRDPDGEKCDPTK